MERPLQGGLAVRDRKQLTTSPLVHQRRSARSVSSQSALSYTSGSRDSTPTSAHASCVSLISGGSREELSHTLKDAWHSRHACDAPFTGKLKLPRSRRETVIIDERAESKKGTRDSHHGSTETQSTGSHAMARAHGAHPIQYMGSYQTPACSDRASAPAHQERKKRTEEWLLGQETCKVVSCATDMDPLGEDFPNEGLEGAACLTQSATAGLEGLHSQINPQVQSSRGKLIAYRRNDLESRQPISVNQQCADAASSPELAVYLEDSDHIYDAAPRQVRLEGGGLAINSALPWHSTNSAQGVTSAGARQGTQSCPSVAKRQKTAHSFLGDIPEEMNDDEKDEAPQPPGPKDGKGKERAVPFLACPYFKHNPAKHTGRLWRGCCGPGWESVHRLKEHLYRRHRQPKYRCKRCGEPFQEEADLNGHARTAEPCMLQLMLPMDGFDSKQEEELKSRKRAVTGLSEVERWRHTYRILFPLVPEAEIPSPFYEYTEPCRDSLSNYEEYFTQIMKGSLGTAMEHEVAAGRDSAGGFAHGMLVDIFLKYHHMCIRDFRNGPMQQIASPTLTAGSQTLEMGSYGCRPTPASSAAPVALEEHTASTVHQLFLDPVEYAPMDNFDFGLYSFAPGLVEVIVEQSLDESTTRPSDSAYGSLTSTKAGSECPAAEHELVDCTDPNERHLEAH